jgi:hypothetical protein
MLPRLRWSKHDPWRHTTHIRSRFLFLLLIWWSCDEYGNGNRNTASFFVWGWMMGIFFFFFLPGRLLLFLSFLQNGNGFACYFYSGISSNYCCFYLFFFSLSVSSFFFFLFFPQIMVCQSVCFLFCLCLGEFCVHLVFFCFLSLKVFLLRFLDVEPFGSLWGRDCKYHCLVFVSCVLFFFLFCGVDDRMDGRGGSG